MAQRVTNARRRCRVTTGWGRRKVSTHKLRTGVATVGVDLRGDLKVSCAGRTNVPLRDRRRRVRMLLDSSRAGFRADDVSGLCEPVPARLAGRIS